VPQPKKRKDENIQRFILPVVLYAPNIITMVESIAVRWAGQCSMHGSREEPQRFGQETLKENLEVDRRDGIKMGFKEIGRDSVDWIHLAQERSPSIGWALVCMVMNL
jgi:hypothetical protein